MSKLKSVDKTSNFNTDKTQINPAGKVSSGSVQNTKHLRDRKRRRLDRRSIFVSRVKRRALRHLWFVRAGIVVAIFLAVFLVFSLVGTVFRSTHVGFYAGLISDFIFAPDGKAKVQDGRTNIIIMGKAGQGHDAPELTDTIIFTSVNHSVPSVTLISIPRDIWIPELRAKLNSSYYWGEQIQQGGGLVLSKSTVEQIVGVPVHYAFIIDFSGFVEIIDELGGIEIEVEVAFTDERYPIPGKEEDECGGDPEYKCRYEMVSFRRGVQVTNGEDSLKFVRSRNAEGDEGTDLARGLRQQKVLEAIKEKALSISVLGNPKKVSAILSVLRKSVETDIDPAAGMILLRRLFSAEGNTYSEVLSEDLLINPTISPFYDNLYVFIPKDDTWSEVHEWVVCVLENGNCN